MKAESDPKKNHFIFRREQVLSTELGEFLEDYHPLRLSGFQLRNLFGHLSIEIEDAVKCGDVATIPEARALIRALHVVWPFAGFFLDLNRPLGSAKTLGSLPILSYALCLTDLEIISWDNTGKCAIGVNYVQLRNFRDQCFQSICDLGKRAEIPLEVLLGRQSAIARQFSPVIENP